MSTKNYHIFMGTCLFNVFYNDIFISRYISHGFFTIIAFMMSIIKEIIIIKLFLNRNKNVLLLKYLYAHIKLLNPNMFSVTQK